MATPIDFLKLSAVKAFIQAQGLRSSTPATDLLNEQITGLLERVILEAVARANDEKMKTLMPEHIEYALAKHVGKHDLDWQGILAQILQETPADLGKITQGIRDHIAASSRP